MNRFRYIEKIIDVCNTIYVFKYTSCLWITGFIYSDFIINEVVSLFPNKIMYITIIVWSEEFELNAAHNIPYQQWKLTERSRMRWPVLDGRCPHIFNKFKRSVPTYAEGS